jgi:hypothetical protein
MSPNGHRPRDGIAIIEGTVTRLKGRHVRRDYKRQLLAHTNVAVFLQVLRISPQDCSRLRRQDISKGTDASGCV